MYFKFFTSIQFLPYIQLARLHRPVGIWLLLWPCFFGVALAHGDFYNYFLFFIGAVAMRSAGCIINDIIDKDFDKKIQRTKNRPLASNLLTQKQAFIAFFVFLSIGAIVWIQLNQAAKYASVIAGIMMVIYPFMKRFTYWPQLFLGFTFNSGLIIAFLHVAEVTWTGPLESIFCSMGMLVRYIWPILMALVLWTIFYDTIYAFADIKDDQKANVKSTAILMQRAPKTWLTLVNILSHLLLFWFLLPWGWLGGIPSFLGFIFLQILLKNWDPNNPENSIKIFAQCHYWGLIEFLWILVIRIFSPYGV